MSPVQTLTSEGGLSLELIGPFTRAPELEQGSVDIAALSDPWNLPDQFRPRLRVEVQAATPERATTAQLAARAIATEITAGRRVAACDVWAGPDGTGELTAQRVISLDSGMGTTLMRILFVEVRGDRAVSVLMECGAEHHRQCLRVVEHAVSTLRGDFTAPAPAPDPDAMPRLDEFGAQAGTPLEYLGGVRAAQRRARVGFALTDDDLRALAKGKFRRHDTTALEAAGLIDGGRLTASGEAARQALQAPLVELTVEVGTDRGEGTTRLSARQRAEFTLIVADPAVGSEQRGRTCELIATGETPLALADWLGLAPAWSAAIGDRASGTTVDGELMQSRLHDPHTPAPSDAGAALARMWQLPWEQAQLSSSRSGTRRWRIVTTTEAGSFLVSGGPAESELTLTPLPSFLYLNRLLGLSGFAVDGEPV